MGGWFPKFQGAWLIPMTLSMKSLTQYMLHVRSRVTDEDKKDLGHCFKNLIDHQTVKDTESLVELND